MLENCFVVTQLHPKPRRYWKELVVHKRKSIRYVSAKGEKRGIFPSSFFGDIMNFYCERYQNFIDTYKCNVCKKRNSCDIREIMLDDLPSQNESINESNVLEEEPYE